MIYHNHAVMVICVFQCFNSLMSMRFTEFAVGKQDKLAESYWKHLKTGPKSYVSCPYHVLIIKKKQVANHWNQLNSGKSMGKMMENDGTYWKMMENDLLDGWETLGSSLASHFIGNTNTHSSLAPS